MQFFNLIIYYAQKTNEVLLLLCDRVFYMAIGQTVALELGNDPKRRKLVIIMMLLFRLLLLFIISSTLR